MTLSAPRSGVTSNDSNHKNHNDNDKDDDDDGNSSDGREMCVYEKRVVSFPTDVTTPSTVSCILRLDLAIHFAGSPRGCELRYSTVCTCWR